MLPLEVRFTSDDAVDRGGPRRELLSLFITKVAQNIDTVNACYERAKNARLDEEMEEVLSVSHCSMLLFSFGLWSGNPIQISFILNIHLTISFAFA